jgi:HlyD family secretion protein
VIKTRATLIATNAPKEVFSRQDGRLIRLFVHNSQIVSSGDILAFIESTAKHEQIIKLNGLVDSTIDDLQKSNTQFIVTRFAINLEQLGELQLGYQQFISSYQQFADYLQNGFYLKKKEVLGEDLVYLLKNNTILKQQKELILKDLNLSEESYKANEQLYKDRVISKQDDRNEQSKLLNKQLSIPQINASLLNNESQQREKQKEITELEHSISIQKTIFLQAAQTLKSLLEDWEKKYIIKAPVAGKLTFLVPLQENEFIKSGRSLGFVAPQNSQYYAEIIIPQYNFGKTDTNQAVQLRFDAYPYQEYGFVQGRIKYISDIPTDSGFVAHVQIPLGLITNQKKEVKYREGLKAEALIITKDMRLTERFYYNLTSSLKR